MNSREIAVLGDAELAQQIRAALNKEGYSCLHEGDLEIQDEWQVRKWLSEHQPKYVFLCIGVASQASSSSLLFTLRSGINVITGSLGYAVRLRLVSGFMSNEFFLLRRLCELFRFEKQVDFSDIVSDREHANAFAARCVLEMRDVVSAQKKKAQGSAGSLEGREVRDQVLPQSQGRSAENMLEVQKPKAQAAPSTDLRPQHTTSAG